MLGPFTTASRLTSIHQMSLAVLSRAACASIPRPNDNDDNAWQRGTAMAPWNGLNGYEPLVYAQIDTTCLVHMQFGAAAQRTKTQAVKWAGGVNDAKIKTWNGCRTSPRGVVHDVNAASGCITGGKWHCSWPLGACTICETAAAAEICDISASSRFPRTCKTSRGW